MSFLWFAGDPEDEELMGLPRGELIGGPFDGQRMAGAARPSFIWVAQAGNGVRVHGTPTAKRHLYRSLGRDRGKGEKFIYAENTHRYCGCGGYNEIAEGERNPHCELCGSPLGRQTV